MRAKNGFTLIELLVALAIVGMIVAIAAPRYFSNIDRTKEDVLREDLYLMRDAIDKYFADHNAYTNELEDLVKEKYLRGIPKDPFTNSRSTWIVIPPETAAHGAVANVRSGAAGTGRDNTQLGDW